MTTTLERTAIAKDKLLPPQTSKFGADFLLANQQNVQLNITAVGMIVLVQTALAHSFGLPELPDWTRLRKNE